MTNFQKIFAAVIIFGLLGLGACVSSQPDEPKEGTCIGFAGAKGQVNTVGYAGANHQDDTIECK